MEESRHEAKARKEGSRYGSSGRLAVMAVALALVMPGCVATDRAPDLSMRPRLVWLNAFAVANPDFRVIHERQVKGEGESSEAVQMLVEPRWPSPSFSEQYARYQLEITRTSSGKFDTPRLYPWRMTEILRRFWREGSETDSEDAASLLKGLDGAAVRVSAVVELVQPMSEADVKKIWPYQIDVALLSPAGPGNPLSWDQSGYCSSRGFDTCKSDVKDSLMSEFQHWVSFLEADDEVALGAFGLSLGELQRRSQEGRYYGFILNAYPSRIRSIVGDEKIRSIQVADVSMAGL
ncbi:hypothetical protein AB0F88_01370 [Streptosporangium sp. NPDC023963]|uniref:hypothetical protein n=1 Tax=Streptosporangium sp. NPDC023963 TaxID=3155608 RepID=UPI00342C45D9